VASKGSVAQRGASVIQQHRTIFLSDLHLGAKGAQAELVLDFLQHNDARTIYLVGDFIDGWKLKRGWYWPQAHNDVVQILLAKARDGARIVLLPGNHDEFLREFVGLRFGALELAETALHAAADGRVYLVIHGDQFDAVVLHAGWLARIGDWAYVLAMGVSSLISAVRRRMGLTYWSFSAWAKHKVKKAVNFVSSFEALLTQEARRRGAQGVICGHIHHAAMRDLDGIAYLNCGDWVESCTALVEDAEGRFSIIRWRDERQAKPLVDADRRPRVVA
jgi:UDP-2,3-diacylglucosamine pyrophosphatase LpxH